MFRTVRNGLKRSKCLKFAKLKAKIKLEKQYINARIKFALSNVLKCNLWP